MSMARNAASDARDAGVTVACGAGVADAAVASSIATAVVKEHSTRFLSN
jgi:hypothetical protein